LQQYLPQNVLRARLGVTVSDSQEQYSIRQPPMIGCCNIMLRIEQKGRWRQKFTDTARADISHSDVKK